MAVTKEVLEKMLKAMDKDGDGQCSKAEFKGPYLAQFGQMDDKEYDIVWKKIDTDSSGDVSVTELAAYFGFKFTADGKLEPTKDDMDDDDILAMLAMADNMSVLDAIPASAPRDKKVSTDEKQIPVKLITKAGKFDDLERELLEEAMLDTATFNKLTKIIDAMVAKKLTVRICDENQKLAVHHLARHGDSAKNIIRRLLEEGGESKKDINYQDSAGKTPLHYATEYKSVELMKMLLDRGSSPLKTTKEEWTVLHSAVQTAAEAVVETLLLHEKVQPKKKDLMDATDNQGRNALHVASFRCDESVIRLLLDHGADPKKADKTGNKAATLAGKGGRRKSRELLDAFG